MSTDNTKMSENAITPSVLNKMFGRALMYGASWNYERMQNLGFLYMMVPALKRTYKNNTPAMARRAVETALSAAGLEPILSVAPRDTLGPAHTVCRRAVCRE